MRDRQMLAKEVEFLHHQMIQDASDILYPSHKQQVDDILKSVKHVGHICGTM